MSGYRDGMPGSPLQMLACTMCGKGPLRVTSIELVYKVPDRTKLPTLYLSGFDDSELRGGASIEIHHCWCQACSRYVEPPDLCNPVIWNQEDDVLPFVAVLHELARALSIAHQELDITDRQGVLLEWWDTMKGSSCVTDHPGGPHSGLKLEDRLKSAQERGDTIWTVEYGQSPHHYVFHVWVGWDGVSFSDGFVQLDMDWKCFYGELGAIPPKG